MALMAVLRDAMLQGRDTPVDQLRACCPPISGFRADFALHALQPLYPFALLAPLCETRSVSQTRSLSSSIAVYWASLPLNLPVRGATRRSP